MAGRARRGGRRENRDLGQQLQRGSGDRGGRLRRARSRGRGQCPLRRPAGCRLPGHGGSLRDPPRGAPRRERSRSGRLRASADRTDCRRERGGERATGLPASAGVREVVSRVRRGRGLHLAQRGHSSQRLWHGAGVRSGRLHRSHLPHSAAGGSRHARQPRGDGCHARGLRRVSSRPRASRGTSCSRTSSPHLPLKRAPRPRRGSCGSRRTADRSTLRPACGRRGRRPLRPARPRP